MFMYSIVYHTSLCISVCVSQCLYVPVIFFLSVYVPCFPVSRSQCLGQVSLVSLVTVSPSVSVYPSVYVCQGLCPIVYTLK